ncbi:polymeric immunoglobulin receptor-like isoform X2 [Silurus meridionalis]|uniref:polymeric immunoglobulin receptor-like isoform X2 n=1 Tax=Silurus meridionalis TaxID=175797 RepID=UPI001EEBFC1A|nr:polymeric immunoglobulin receptor-like isoform X2 [Silurus meridionalis]
MKILLLIFTFCLISDGGDSKEVTEYSGRDVLFRCKYDTEYTQNPKYFCKGSSPGCSDLIKTEDKNMWVTSGRFSLFDDTKLAEFWVMIKQLTVEDTGTYQCGVDISREMDIYTPVELKVKEDGGASKEVTGYSGGGVLIKCKYNTGYKENIKYFCKGSSPGCSDQIKTGVKNLWVSSGRFSLFDDTKSAEFRVMIREITVEDTGTYQCGVDISFGKDIYTPVELKVKEDGGASKEVTGYSGGGVLIKCKYNTGYKENIKYFCKGSSPGCSDQIKTGVKNLWVSSGRFSLFDDTKSAEFRVMIREITVEDTGTYQCGVDISFGKDIYTPVELKVKEDGGASKEVTGYSGGGVLIKCKYNTKYKGNLKYFCKGSWPGCSDLIKTGDTNMWVTSGRFSLFDDTKSAEITVMIREITVEDTGTYQCGVDKSWGNIYTQVELKVKEDLSYEKSISKTVHVGGDLNISCKYPQSLRNHAKFLCKGLQPAACVYSESVTESRKDVNVGKFSLYDDKTEQIFTVSIRNVIEQDSGEYWCGAEADWTSDHGYKVYFTQISLTVTDGGASKEVTGYSGSEILIKCKYDTEYTQNLKKFCKGSSPGCFDLIKTGDKNMWVTSGRFSLFDDTKSAEFSVMIRELTVEDTGTYHCGVHKSWGNDIYTPVELKVKEDLSYEKSISKTVHVGGDLKISCKYPESLRNHAKFLCKGLQPAACVYSESVTESRKDINVGKFHLYDDRTEQIFTVSIRNVSKQDSGEYWCGAEAAWTSDHGYNVYFTQISLTVTDGGASKEVTGYSGGGVLIKCKYDTEYIQNPKYFCNGSSPGCSDLIKTGDKNMWVTSGRFSLFDDTKSAEFSVMIRELTVEDTGTYQCGVDISWAKDIYTPVELKVKEDLSYEKFISKTVHVGGDLHISCKYPQSLRNHAKFLCQRLQPAACVYKESVTESRKDVNVGKFSLYDDRTEQIFTVSIRNVIEQDSGEYWCGAEAAWTSDHGYKVYFTQIRLTVTDPRAPVSTLIPTQPSSALSSSSSSSLSSSSSSSLYEPTPASPPGGFSASTVITVSVILLLLLIGISVLLVILQKGQKMKGGTAASHRTSVQSSGNNQEVPPALSGSICTTVSFSRHSDQESGNDKGVLLPVCDCEGKSTEGLMYTTVIMYSNSTSSNED